MQDETAIGGPDRGFPATRFSAILRARSEDPAERERAVESLIEVYWKPIYKYLRLRWRQSNEDAKDLTQEFFASLIEKGFLSAYDPEKARLRTYLRVCADRLAQNQGRAAKRLKRGGGSRILPMDFVAAEAELARIEPPPADAMEEFFDREWIRSLFALAVEALEADCARRDRPLDFQLFETYDLEAGSDPRPTYSALAERHGVTSATITNRLAAARRLFRRLLLEKLREMTGSDEEFRREARSLLGTEPG